MTARNSSNIRSAIASGGVAPSHCDLYLAKIRICSVQNFFSISPYPSKYDGTTKLWLAYTAFMASYNERVARLVSEKADVCKHSLQAMVFTGRYPALRAKAVLRFSSVSQRKNTPPALAFSAVVLYWAMPMPLWMPKARQRQNGAQAAP